LSAAFPSFYFFSGGGGGGRFFGASPLLNLLTTAVAAPFTSLPFADPSSDPSTAVAARGTARAECMSLLIADEDGGPFAVTSPDRSAAAATGVAAGAGFVFLFMATEEGGVGGVGNGIGGCCKAHVKAGSAVCKTDCAVAVSCGGGGGAEGAVAFASVIHKHTLTHMHIVIDKENGIYIRTCAHVLARTHEHENSHAA